MFHGKNLLDDSAVKQIITAFDLLQDVLFWVKDIDSRFIYCNSQFMHHLGCKDMDHLIGKNDYDFSPPHLAKQYVEDDQRVLSGKLVTNRLELNSISPGKLGWFSTSKRILKNGNDDIIGTYGLTRHLQKTSKALSNVKAVDAPVKYIQKNYHKAITVEQLAKDAHLSVSALERRFRKYLAKTPNQFINEVRLDHARRLLIESQLPIADIAFQCGFSEPSYFSKQFFKMFGEQPLQYRKSRM
ncbi:AraC family transcriptional regulator [Thalassotalea agarivorans]|uniref:PAS fold-containing protein n=1 Tax=Thalassotalea agarivorans TaxID=349064 RepID=A0A1H9Y7U9_THASX|nr:AraC family transcriptional regulator [Thalassotalea agarivorans]SES65016.1 PAS fold-containing protein [Thalassotalea agarivorans]